MNLRRDAQESREVKEKVVPRDGIEPPTRGFSGNTPGLPNFL
jgi:hypothetical protein